MLITLDQLKSSLQAVKSYINSVLPKKVSDLTDDSGHYTKPSGGIPASDLADGVVPVEDVQMNGASILDAQGVANVPIMDINQFGIAKLSNNGITIDLNGALRTMPAGDSSIKGGTVNYNVIVPRTQHESTFYGLAKAAGDTTQSSSNNAVGTYTDEAKIAINKMIGSYGLNSGEAIPTNADLNTYTTPGTYNADSTVIASITNAPTTTETYKLVVETVSETVIEQIVTAANGKVYRRTGDSSSTSWTFSNWIKDINSTDVASPNVVGVVKIGDGFSNNGDGTINVDFVNADQVKAGASQRKSITPYQQHRAVFYGLAKVAGVDMSSSSNALGTYTDDAKAAIQDMLDVPSNSDHASRSQYGLVKLSSAFQLNSYDEIVMSSPTLSLIKNGTSPYVGLTPQIQHESVFYGLAKASGDTTQVLSDNAVGTYTDDAKTAIRTMLGTIGDVQLNGTSIVENGIANIPRMTQLTVGVAKLGQGLTINSNNQIQINKAFGDLIKNGVNEYQPIVPVKQHESVFYGLAKLAGSDMKDSSNAVGTYTDAAKSAIKTMLGVPTDSYDLNLGSDIPANADLNAYTTPGTYNADTTVISGITNAPTTTETYKLVVESIDDDLIRQTAISKSHVYQRTGDVSTSSWVFSDWVQNITSTDYATQTTGGIAKVGGYGLNLINGKLYVQRATDEEIKDCVNGNKPIVPLTQNAATFYGLAKAAGDTTQSSSSNAVGTYTTEAKSAIRTMLGTVGDVQVNGTSVTSNGVANIPMAGNGVIGAVAINNGYGINIRTDGIIYINRPTSANIKLGTGQYQPIVPYNQHEATFYGLAKAAGADMASSNNAVGTYTQEAKTAIQTMLGVTVPEAVGSCVEYITDSSVTIVGEPNTRYVCGEVTSIDITPPAVGTIDVTFTSGSTIAILTLPSTVKMPEWWGGVETGYTYELIITDGVYAGVMAWPQ